MFTEIEKMNASRDIEKCIKGLSSQEAIKVLDAKFGESLDPAIRAQYLVSKSRALWALDSKSLALDILRDCAARYPDNDFILVQLSEYLIESCLYSEAIPHLSAAIQIEMSNEEKWYGNMAIILRAYSYAKIGDKMRAEIDYSLLTDDDDITWVEADPLITKESICRMIADLKK